jgi:hypothetical protein
MTKGEVLRFLLQQFQWATPGSHLTLSTGYVGIRADGSGTIQTTLSIPVPQVVDMPQTRLSTAELLATAVLDGDESAAGWLVDYLQENGIDAVTEATRLERERVMQCVVDAMQRHGDPAAELQVFAPLGELLTDIELLVHGFDDK